MNQRKPYEVSNRGGLFMHQWWCHGCNGGYSHFGDLNKPRFPDTWAILYDPDGEVIYLCGWCQHEQQRRLNAEQQEENK